MRMVTCIDLSYTTYKQKSLENSSYIYIFLSLTFVKNKDWGRRRRGGLNREGGLIEDLR